MPVVQLRIRPNQLLEQLVISLLQALPEIVAPQLTISDRPDGHITAEDIIIHFSHGSNMDINAQDIEIIILAHDFPERRVNLEERTQKILEGMRRFLADYDCNPTGYVWILLVPTAFRKL